MRNYRVNMGCASFQCTVGVGNRTTSVVVKVAFDIASHDTTERSAENLSQNAVVALKVGNTHTRS